MEVLAIIPARGSSRGIPKKNIKDLCGHPLLAYSVTAAVQSEKVTRVICSTDDEEIAEIANEYGAEIPFLRPNRFAQDKSQDIELFIHALEWFKSNENYCPDYVVQLRPTSPVRLEGVVDKAISELEKNTEFDSLRSICHPSTTPYKMWEIGKKNQLVPLLSIPGVKEPYNSPRQDLPEVFMQTGVIEVIRPDTILKKRSLTGDKILSFKLDDNYVIDIDTELDFKKAELVIEEGKCIFPKTKKY